MYNLYFGSMALPVVPGKLTVKIKGNNKTLTLVNESEINFLRTPGLTEITFDAVLPMLGQYSFSGSYKRPDFYLNTFEKLMIEKKTFRFILNRFTPSGKLLYDTNMKVSLENYTIIEDAAQGMDVTVQITLKQYVDYATKTITIVRPTKNGGHSVVENKQREASSAPNTQTYVVQSGDCLWNIAKKYYGDGAQYTKIFNANKDKIANPNLIYVGQVLTIP